MRFRAFLSVLLLVCASHPARGAEEPPAPPPPDIPKHLTLDEAVDIFRARGFDLLLADAAAAGARGDLRAAQAFPNPLLAASACWATSIFNRRLPTSRSISSPWSETLALTAVAEQPAQDES